MVEDFMARRRAAIEAKRALIEEMKAADERDYQLDCAEQEFDDWIEHERLKRQKYEQAMAEKRRREADLPAYEILADRYDDPHQRGGGPDAGEDIF
jgi:hypothetical protein